MLIQFSNYPRLLEKRISGVIWLAKAFPDDFFCCWLMLLGVEINIKWFVYWESCVVGTCICPHRRRSVKSLVTRLFFCLMWRCWENHQKYIVIYTYNWDSFSLCLFNLIKWCEYFIKIVWFNQWYRFISCLFCNLWLQLSRCWLEV